MQLLLIDDQQKLHDRGVEEGGFVDVVTAALEDVSRLYPVEATALGDHRGDDRLPDLTAAGLDERRRALSSHLAAVDGLDHGRLSVSDAVDAAILRARLSGLLLALDETRDLEWNPLEWNPGTAVYLLLARDFAPLGQRLRSVAARLAAVPEHLRTARRTLEAMPRVHVETAVGQFTGTRTLLEGELERALDREPALRPEVEPARELAVAAIDEHVAWLRQRLDRDARDPRLGAELYARKLAHSLDTATDPGALLAHAEAELPALEERLAAVAARLGGSPRAVLDRLAAEGHVDDATVVSQCEAALAHATSAVRGLDLVTVPDDPVQVIVMPEIHRGVAVAYCDPPGPLETRRLPTYFAVAPTPADWPAERVASFYREYNAHMLHNLTVHEAMPGHALQLAHARRFVASTPVRAAFWSGTFVEGWAVLAEELMVEAGYDGAGSADALGLQRLKMALRMTINAILDVRVHTRGMTQAEAMELMTRRGHQEEGEAAGKWRRALLTSAQLPTYYVGYTELREVARGLPPGPRRYDSLLAHGSPAPRYLRALLTPPPQ